MSPRTAASTFLRSLLIQGSWNYHTMLGNGFAFCLLPGLRTVETDEDGLQEAVDRHVELFNAHPYLSTVALGAVLRLEADGAEPDTVRRFKLAVRGPLGGLGDALVWATWLPGVAVLALALYWLGVPGWIAVTVFLVTYNVGHIGLRIWGLRTGLAAGRDVAATLARADLGGWTRRLQPVVALLLGLLMGAVLGGDGGLVESSGPWPFLAVLGFVAGLKGGHRTWRPAAVVTVAAICAFALWGVFA